MNDGVRSIAVEFGKPVIDVSVRVPDPSPKGGPASSDLRQRVAEKWGECFEGLDSHQAETIMAYWRYGHYFCRKVLLRNSYELKDLLANMVAAHVSQNDVMSEEVVRWSGNILRRHVQNPNPKNIGSYRQIYDWCVDMVWILESQGFPVKVEKP